MIELILQKLTDTRFIGTPALRVEDETSWLIATNAVLFFRVYIWSF